MITGKRPSSSSVLAAAESGARKKKKASNEGPDNGSTLKKMNIGFIGSGNMARALVQGILSSPSGY